VMGRAMATSWWIGLPDQHRYPGRWRNHRIEWGAFWAQFGHPIVHAAVFNGELMATDGYTVAAFDLKALDLESLNP